MPTNTPAAACAGLQWSRVAGAEGRLGTRYGRLWDASGGLGRDGGREGPGGRLWSGFSQGLPLWGPLVFLT